MNSLPIEIITLILLNVCNNDSNNIKNLFQVCSSWKNIVWNNEYFYLRLLRENYLTPKQFLEDPLLQSIIVEHSYYNIIYYLLTNGPLEPSAENNYSIRYMCRFGYDVLLRVLLENSNIDPSQPRNKCIKYATKYGHYNCVVLLINDYRVNPCVDNLKCLKYIIINEDYDLFNLFINNYRIKQHLKENQEDANCILAYTCRWSVESVTQLMELSGINVTYQALKISVENLEIDILELLFSKYSSVDTNLDELFKIISCTIPIDAWTSQRLDCWKIIENNGYKCSNNEILDTCINNTIKHHHYELCEYLLQNYPNKKSLINTCIKYGNVEIFRTLLYKYSSIPQKIPSHVIYSLCDLVYVSNRIDAKELLNLLITNVSNFDCSIGHNILLRCAIQYDDYKTIKLIWPKVKNELLNPPTT